MRKVREVLRLRHALSLSYREIGEALGVSKTASCVSAPGPIGDYAMNIDSKNPSSPQSDVSPTSQLFDDWIDPIESGVRARVRDWIEALVHSELDAALQRPRSLIAECYGPTVSRSPTRTPLKFLQARRTGPVRRVFSFRKQEAAPRGSVWEGRLSAKRNLLFRHISAHHVHRGDVFREFAG